MLVVQKVISKKEFNQIKEETGASIIGFSCLEKYDKKKHKKKRSMLLDEKEYVVADEMNGITRKYAQIGGTDFIAIKTNPVLIPLLLVLILGLAFGIAVAVFNTLPKDDGGDKIIVDGGVEIDLGKQPMVGEQEGIAFPGLGVEYILTESKKNFNLINPENNTVYFMYTLYADDKEIFKTDWIPPNRMVEANLYDILDAGTYNISVHVDTLDCVTKEGCTTTDSFTKITIKK